MKQLLCVATVSLFLFACNQPATTATENKKATDTTLASAQNIKIPYTPTYSTDFEFGDYKFAEIVLNNWKDYDDNIFKEDNIFADTVIAHFSDGSSIKGKDSLISAIKQFRNSLTSVKESILTYAVLKPKDKDETWVSIWSNEIDVYKNGKTDTIQRNQIWKFNKEGKVTNIDDYTAK